MGFLSFKTCGIGNVAYFHQVYFQQRKILKINLWINPIISIYFNNKQNKKDKLNSQGKSTSSLLLPSHSFRLVVSHGWKKLLILSLTDGLLPPKNFLDLGIILRQQLIPCVSNFILIPQLILALYSGFEYSRIQIRVHAMNERGPLSNEECRFSGFYLKHFKALKIAFVPKSTASSGIRSFAACMVREKLKSSGSGIGKKP